MRSSWSGEFRAVNPISERFLSMYLTQILGLNLFGRSRPFLSVYVQRPNENPPAKNPRAGAESKAKRER